MRIRIRDLESSQPWDPGWKKSDPGCLSRIRTTVRNEVFLSGSHEKKKITRQRNNFPHLLFNFWRLDVFLLAGLAEAALAAVLERRTEAVRPEVLLIHLVRVLLTLVRRGLLVLKILALLHQTTK
jgi:hypothetical protein